MHPSFREGFEKAAAPAVSVGTINKAKSFPEATKRINNWIKQNPRPTSSGGLGEYWKR